MFNPYTLHFIEHIEGISLKCPSSFEIHTGLFLVGTDILIFPEMQNKVHNVTTKNNGHLQIGGKSPRLYILLR